MSDQQSRNVLPHLGRSRGRAFGVLVAAAVVVLTGCSAPGATSNKPSGTSPSAVSKDIGTKPITLNITMSSGSEQEYVQKTGAMFTKLHPNVTFNITAQAFTTLVQNAQHLVTGSHIPDMIQLANYGRLVKDGLLENLDPYAKLYGWDQWDAEPFAGLSMANGGTELGSGSLYGIGHGANIVGVYYNKALAKKIGMTTPPKTLAEFESDMAKAKAAGVNPPLVVNGQDGLISYPLQSLAVDYAGSVKGVQDWIYQKAGASIDDANWVKAAATVQDWNKKGYLSSNVVSLNQTDASNQYAAGEGLFYETGDWSAPQFDGSKTQQFGFFPFPPLQQGGLIAGMTAQNIFSIPSGAKNKNAMAAYLNFILTNKDARQLTYDLTGTVPPAIPGAAELTVKAGTSQADSVKVDQDISAAGGLMGFMANATQAMSTTLFPDTQLLVAAKMTPQQFVTKVQSDYESGLVSK